MPQTSITVWLEQIGLGQFARLFADQQIEVTDLPELSEQDLEKLGIPTIICSGIRPPAGGGP